MIGVNYRYEFNEKKGTLKLAPTKSMWITTIVTTFAPWVVLYAVGTYFEKKEERELRLVKNETEDQ